MNATIASRPTAVELAPLHKQGLKLDNPVMTSAGCYGLGTEYKGLVDVEALGAIVVGPLTLNPRKGAPPPRALPVPGGVLLHTGMANVGLSVALRRYSRVWERSPVPVILHLADSTPGMITTACLRLSAVNDVAAVELGLGNGLDQETVAEAVAAAKKSLRQPLLVRLPLSDAAWLARPAVEAGADALTVAAPPRGTAGHGDRFVTGRLYGSWVFPLALGALRLVAGVVDVPLVGCGGVTTGHQGLAFLQAGATAVQVDAVLWRDPSAAARIAHEIAAASADGE